MPTDRERFDQFVLKAQEAFDVGYEEGLQALREGKLRDPDVRFPLTVEVPARKIYRDGWLFPYLQDIREQSRQAARATKAADMFTPAELQGPVRLYAPQFEDFYWLQRGPLSKDQVQVYYWRVGTYWRNV